MRVLFLIPPSPGKRRIVRLIDCSYESKAAYLWQPNDYLLISSLLAPTDEAVLIDATADRLDEAAFFARVQAERADLVFFSLSSTCWQWDHQIYQRVRQLFARTPLYLIGDIFLEEEYLSFILPQCEGVVYIPHLLDLRRMVSEAERGNVALPGLHAPGRSTGPEAKRALAAPPGIPRHELFLKEGYVFPFARHLRYATVTMAWGCPFSCFYCNQNGIPPVVRPWQEVVRELEHLENLGVRELFFADKAFGFPRSSAEPLLAEIRARFSFFWSCYFHPQMYRPELLEEMQAAGCHTLIVGFDSADLQSLRQYRRHVEPRRVEQLLEHANRLGLDICADFIIGLEHESEADIRRSIAYARSLPVDFASFNIAAPLPGSGIRKKATAAGKMVFGQEGFDTLARAGVVVNSDITQERILELRRKAVRDFYLRPRYLWRRIRKTRSPEHLWIQMRQLAGMLGKN